MERKEEIPLKLLVSHFHKNAFHSTTHLKFQISRFCIFSSDAFKPNDSENVKPDTGLIPFLDDLLTRITVLVEKDDTNENIHYIVQCTGTSLVHDLTDNGCFIF